MKIFCTTLYALFEALEAPVLKGGGVKKKDACPILLGYI